MLGTPDKTTVSQMTLNISVRKPIDTRISPFFYTVFTNSLHFYVLLTVRLPIMFTYMKKNCASSWLFTKPTLVCLIYQHKHFGANHCITHTSTRSMLHYLQPFCSSLHYCIFTGSHSHTTVYRPRLVHKACSLSPPRNFEKINNKSLLTLRQLMSYIYMEHPFLMFLDHTQRRSTVGRTPLDE